MKKLLSLVAMMLLATTIHAQSPDSVQLSSSPRIMAYAELLGWNTNVLGLGKKAKVEVEFGDESWGWQGNDGRNLLVDENGDDIKFNSMVDAMNYMAARGWKFEAAYVVTVSNQPVVHWLMSKEVFEGEDPRKGIQQRRDKKKKDKKKDKDYDPLYD